MNQEKIGKFICECRKAKKITQSELADKLGVTNRSVSNWENGKNMPDLSLFKPLCDILGITLNDLMSGESINNKNYQNKFEENVTNMVLYSRKSFFKQIMIVSILLLFIVLIGEFFLVNKRDVNNSNDFDYEVALNTKEVEQNIERYVIKNMPNAFTRLDEKTFDLVNVAQSHIFMIDEKSADEIIVYSWVMAGSHYLEFKDGENYVNYSKKIAKPYVFTMKRDGYRYEIIRVNEAEVRDVGTEEVYGDYDYKRIDAFIEEYFPEKIKNNAKKYCRRGNDIELVHDYWETVDNIYLYLIDD